MVLVSVHDVALYRRASICDRITGGRLRRSSAHERSRVSASPVSPENRSTMYMDALLLGLFHVVR